MQTALKNFRTNMRAVMLERGLSQRAMGKKCKMAYPYISKILMGHHVPNMRTACTIAAVLKVSLSELVGSPKARKAKCSDIKRNMRSIIRLERHMVSQHTEILLLRRELEVAHEQAGHYRAILEQIGYFAEETHFFSFTVTPELSDKLMSISAATGLVGSDLLAMLVAK